MNRRCRPAGGVAPVMTDLLQRVQALEEVVALQESTPLLIDANGEVIGEVIGLGAGDPTWAEAYVYASVNLSHTEAIIRVENFPTFPIQAGQGGIKTPDYLRPVIYFESEDCSGTAWVAPPIGIVPDVFTDEPGNTAYMGDPSSAPQPTIVWSKRSPYSNRYGSGYGNCEASPEANFDERGAIPVVSVLDLDAMATPPFHVD
jgi:hypothetical protein